MRPAVIGFATLVAVFSANAPSGYAQESFFNNRYCSIPGGSGSGSFTDCSFATLEQCRASARGSTRYCAENQNFKTAAAAERGKTRKAAR
jgi:hypothetical protein